jgi:hypothetical protein
MSAGARRAGPSPARAAASQWSYFQMQVNTQARKVTVLQVFRVQVLFYIQISSSVVENHMP